MNVYLRSDTYNVCKLHTRIWSLTFQFAFILCNFPCIISSKENMRAAGFEPGGPEKLYVSEVSIPTLRDKEVLIKVVCTAINRADTLQRKGGYPPPPSASLILGLEAAGIIEKLGPNCGQKWKVGDRVMALLAGGGNAEYVAANEDHLIAIPPDMNFEVAAAIPETWLTAFQLLHTVGKVESGEWVFIHAGGSGVGTAAIQLTLLAGAKPIITAGSPSKIQTALKLGALAGFNYKEGDFSQNILETTNGKGVNLILDCVGSSFWEQNTQSIATDGRWVLYGLLGGPKVDGNLLGSILRKRIQITGTTLRTRSDQYKADLINNFTSVAMPHFQSGKLRPVIDRVMPLDDISEAHSVMERNENTGKIVLRVQAKDAHSEL